MNYREELLRPLSLNFLNKLLANVYDNPSDFEIIFNLMFDDDPKVSWRAVWACEKISEQQPGFFADDHLEKISSLTLATKNSGSRRLCLSILYNFSSRVNFSVDLINIFFEWMVSPQQPVAVQVISMKLLGVLCEQEPDFCQELKTSLAYVDTSLYSAGFISARRHILKKLD